MTQPTQRGFAVLPTIFIVIALLAVVGVGYMLIKQPFAEETTTNDTADVVVTNTNSIGSNVNTAVTNTAVNTNSSSPEVLPSGVKRYTSDKLGVTFTYRVDYGEIIETGDKIYVGGSDGQWVEVMSKDPGDTLGQAVQKKFLSGIDSKKCFVVEGEKDTNSPATASTARISFPPSSNEDNPWFNAKDCPAHYTTTNGIAYFKMDSAHPEKFLFFSIGQYVIPDWEHTLRMFDSSPTAGWKTYTNTTYRYSIQYPTNWKLSEVLAPKTVQFSPPDAASKTSIELGPTLFVQYKDVIKPLDDTVRNRKSVIINGTTATQQEEGGLGNSITTYFPRNAGGYISTFWDDSFTYSEYQQILSTFTFTK